MPDPKKTEAPGFLVILHRGLSEDPSAGPLGGETGHLLHVGSQGSQANPLPEGTGPQGKTISDYLAERRAKKAAQSAPPPAKAK